MDTEAEWLRTAIAKGDQDAVKEWLAHHQKHVNNIRDEAGRTPLHWAGSGDNYHIPPMLLAAGADPYPRDNAGLLPMDFSPGERETAGRWILRGEHRDNQLVLKHFQERSEADARKSLAYRASRARNRRTNDGRTALMLACEAGRADIVRLLLAAGAPPGDVDWLDGRDAVFVSIEAGQPGCLELVLAADRSLLERRHRLVVNDLPALLHPLHVAALFGQFECIEVLLAYGAPVDARAGGDRHVWTPLHLAARQGHLPIVRRLLDAGADASLAEGRLGFNALQLAMEQKRDAVVALLESWAKERSLDLLRPFHRHANDSALVFPLYQALLHLPAGHCTFCDQTRANQLMV